MIAELAALAEAVKALGGNYPTPNNFSLTVVTDGLQPSYDLFWAAVAADLPSDDLTGLEYDAEGNIIGGLWVRDVRIDLT